MRTARTIKTESPTQKLILMVLVAHAGADGSCWPSYTRLMSESGFTSKSTITDALQYLRDTLKIVTWRKGWGNLHRKGVSNVYKFDFQAMKKLSDESPSEPDESPSDADESPSDRLMKVHLTGDEIPPGRSLSTSREVPAKKEVPVKEEPAVKRATLLSSSFSSSLNPSSTEAGTGEHPNLEESSPDGLSSIPTRITLADLRAKEKHAIAHGGCSVEELNQLRNQIAFMEGN